MLLAGNPERRDVHVRREGRLRGLDQRLPPLLGVLNVEAAVRSTTLSDDLARLGVQNEHFGRLRARIDSKHHRSQHVGLRAYGRMQRRALYAHLTAFGSVLVAYFAATRKRGDRDQAQEGDGSSQQKRFPDDLQGQRHNGLVEQSGLPRQEIRGALARRLDDLAHVSHQALQAAHGDRRQGRNAERHSEQPEDQRHSGGDTPVGIRRGVDGGSADRSKDETEPRAGERQTRDHTDQFAAPQTEPQRRIADGNG